MNSTIARVVEPTYEEQIARLYQERPGSPWQSNPGGLDLRPAGEAAPEWRAWCGLAWTVEVRWTC